MEVEVREDIIDKLREVYSGDVRQGDTIRKRCLDATNEIHRLRASLRHLRELAEQDHNLQADQIKSLRQQLSRGLHPAQGDDTRWLEWPREIPIPYFEGDAGHRYIAFWSLPGWWPPRVVRGLPYYWGTLPGERYDERLVVELPKGDVGNG